MFQPPHTRQGIANNLDDLNVNKLLFLVKCLLGDTSHPMHLLLILSYRTAFEAPAIMNVVRLLFGNTNEDIWEPIRSGEVTLAPKTTSLSSSFHRRDRVPHKDLSDLAK